jgi:hypothetical protein
MQNKISLRTTAIATITIVTIMPFSKMPLPHHLTLHVCNYNELQLLNDYKKFGFRSQHSLWALLPIVKHIEVDNISYSQRPAEKKNKMQFAYSPPVFHCSCDHNYVVGEGYTAFNVAQRRKECSTE